MVAAPAELSGLTALLRRSGATVECGVTGGSMADVVPDGATVRIRCTGLADAPEGEVVALMLAGTLSIHRLVYRARSTRARGWVVTHGDGNLTCDAPLPESAVVGRVESVQRRGETTWHPAGRPASGPWHRAAVTGGVRLVICALLEVHPRAARWAKGLVVIAMTPLTWLRPYAPGRARAASAAHRTQP